MTREPRPAPILPVGPPVSRRRFLVGAAAGFATVVVASCAGHPSTSSSASPVAAATGSGAGSPATTAGRALVLIELDGGNDGLSLLVPSDGRYRDARPTIAVAEKDVIGLTGASEAGLHPKLAPLVPLWTSNRMAAVRGIGFREPNRSHFVSLDRWWHADRPSTALGWLAPWLSSLPTDAERLSGTAVLNRSPILAGGERQPAVLVDPAHFRLDPAVAAGLRAMSATNAGDDPAGLEAVARAGLADATDAMVEVATLTAAGDDGLEPQDPFSRGLAFAAEVVAAATAPTVVVVSSGGFDTHAGQAATHDRLYADLATGITTFWSRADQAGFGDRVLMATTSEFGRRVAENASAGTDHGAGGVSLLFGPAVVPGLHGDTDLGDLLDGDVRPVVDPQVLQAACLDWLGADVEAALGGQWDGSSLVRA
jgi:uncharacterized protein (DUF1501 family)